MNYLRLARWITIAWLLCAGAVTLIASFSESHYLAGIKTHSALGSGPSPEELYDKMQTALRVKKTALAVFICGVPLWLLFWIYGRKSTTSRQEPPPEFDSDF